MTRAAFVYGWYNASKWQEGHVWQPLSGEYDSSTMAETHVNQLSYAKIDVGLYSWQGRQSVTDDNFQSYLDAGLKWAIYYELDWAGGRPRTHIARDLHYLKLRYFGHPNYHHVDGRPVMFVYSPGGDLDTVDKWARLRDKHGLYVSMTDVPNWWTRNTLDSWHGYRPANRVYAVYVGASVYSVSVSAGFHAAWEDVERLPRDFDAFRDAVVGANQYDFPWQLYYFNEWGEGTQIEPSNARCEEFLCSDYLKVLADNP